MKKILMLFLMSVLLNSCNFSANASYENEKVEKENAESVSGLLYLNMSRNDFDSVMDLFSDSFYKISDKKEFKDFLLAKKESLGDFKDFTLEDWKTHRVKGTDSKTEYLLIYKVKYSKYEAVESISLVKENEAVKIIGYHVESEGFFKNK